MSTLITTIEDLKAVNSAVTHDLKIESLVSYLSDARFEQIVLVIGQDTYMLLCQGGDDPVISSAAMMAKKAEGNLALASFIGAGSVKLNETGAFVYQDGNYKIASDKKLAGVIGNAQLAGLRAMDSLLLHLEAHPVIFTKYFESQERKTNLSNFVATTAQFNEALEIDSNPVLFRSLKSFIRDVEVEYIEPILGYEYTGQLRKAILSAELTDLQRILLKHIARAVAPLAIAEAIPYRQVSIDVNGVFVSSSGKSTSLGTDDVQQSADDKRLAMALNNAVIQGKKKVSLLRRFIYQNKDSLLGIGAVDLTSRSTLNQGASATFFV
jgi:hypothetical protein